MSKNYVQEGKHLTLDVGGDLKSGDPVVVGGISGVLMVDADATTHMATVDTQGVYALSVKAVNDSGNSAISVGDPLFYVSGDTPAISKKGSTGTLFGYSLGVVEAGTTATVNVLLVGMANSSEEARIDALEAGKLDVPDPLIPFVADLNETVTKTDIDDNGAIDGTEIAAMLSADHATVNAIKDALVTAGIMSAT